MNELLRTYPLRILLVENETLPRVDLERYLKSPFCFPGANITAVPDRLEARAAIEDSVAAGKLFDCAILDLKIPDRVGEEDYPSSDVADYFVARHLARQRNPQEIWIVHWTGWPDDPEITKFRSALGQRGITHLVVSKIPSTASNSARQIREFLERALVEKALGRLLDDPFFATEMGGDAWAVTIRNARRRQPPMNLVGLGALLADCWKELNEYRRSQAVHAFGGSEVEIVEHGEIAELKYEQARQAAAVWLEHARNVEAPWQ